MLSYRSVGSPSNAPLLLLHGFMGSADDWSDIADRLSDEYYVLAVDLPGHGKSLRLPEEDYAIHGCAARVVELMNELALDKVTLIGYSMGGRVALQMAIRYPMRIVKLALESTTAGIRDARLRIARIESDELKAKQLELGDIEQFVSKWYEHPLFESLRSHPGFLPALMRSRVTNYPAELARSLRHMGTGQMEPLWDQLHRLNVPTLCLAGELDKKYTTLAGELAAIIPSARARIIQGAGHNVHLEQTDQYIQVVRSFL